MKSVDTEISCLKRYSSVLNFFEKTRLLSCFFYDRELKQSADDRLKRLAYFKSSFLVWLAQYKLDRTFDRSICRGSAESLILEPDILDLKKLEEFNKIQALDSSYWNFFRNINTNF